MSLEADPVIARFQETLRDGAACQVTVDRDGNDAFRIQIDPCQEGARTLTEGELESALPAGSRWFPALHWHSYMGGSLVDREGRQWLWLGVMKVKAHPSRHAFPVYVGYFYPADSESRARVSQGLRVLADRIHPVEQGLPPEQVLWSAFERVESQQPPEHARHEARILRAAAALNGEFPHFATLLIEREQVRRLQALRRHHPVLGVYVDGMLDPPRSAGQAERGTPARSLLCQVAGGIARYLSSRRQQRGQEPASRGPQASRKSPMGASAPEPQTARALCEAGYTLLQEAEAKQARLEKCCLEAQGLLRRALELTPGDVDARSGLARAATLLKHFDDAEALLRELLAGELSDSVRRTLEVELARVHVMKAGHGR